MKKFIISEDEIRHLARLANLPLSPEQIKNFPKELTAVLDYMSKIKSLDTQDVGETSQVTNLTNVFRQDIVEKERILTQEEALSNAKDVHNGYFKVKAIFEE